MLNIQPTIESCPTMPRTFDFIAIGGPIGRAESADRAPMAVVSLILDGRGHGRGHWPQPWPWPPKIRLTAIGARSADSARPIGPPIAIKLNVRGIVGQASVVGCILNMVGSPDLVLFSRPSRSEVPISTFSAAPPSLASGLSGPAYLTYSFRMERYTEEMSHISVATHLTYVSRVPQPGGSCRWHLRPLLNNIDEYWWILLNIGEYWCIWVHIDEYWWILMNIVEYWWIWVNMSAYWWMPMNTDEYWWIQYALIFTHIHQYSSIFINIHRYSPIFINIV